MSSACDFFGGRNLVETKVFATLMDLQKEGFIEFSVLRDNVKEALSLVTPDLFQQLMFVSGRALDTAFPQLRELNPSEVSRWSNSRGAGFSVGSNGERGDNRLSAVIALQQTALDEMLSQSQVDESSVDEAVLGDLRIALDKID